MSLEQTVDNLEIRYANAVTFVGTSNTMIDTTTGRIQTKGFQHNSNVITDISGPHGRGAATLKKYPEIVFEEGKFDRNDSTNTYVQAGYVATASSILDSTRQPWEAFNGLYGDDVDGWFSQSGYGGGDYAYNGSANLGSDSGGPAFANEDKGEWLKLEMPHKLIMTHIIIYASGSTRTVHAPEDFKVWGSNDNTNWTEILSETGAAPTVTGSTYNADTTTTAYKYFALVTTKLVNTNSHCDIGELEIFGYEEDPPAGDHSVDTTFKSRFNNPHTTGVQVLVDGATGVGTNQISGGPDPSGNQSTYVTDGKYWTLNGTLTSNLSVEANTFLEGDQPHAVSVWFNSSNLEANVSNTCVFSIASEEKLDSVNLDLQSNTWHNLTYAYQGEGGSRVTYLDGRKVAEDQAEDTFGDYPPFAMTGYSQGGYVVSASSDTYSTTGFYAWKAFNDVQGNEGWHTGTGNGATNHFAANAGGSVYDASLSGGTSSPLSGNLGEWIKLEMPHKLVVDYVTLKARGTSTASTQSPKDFKILGSNDDINWDILESFTSVPYSMTGENHAVGATKGYKYIAFLVTRIYSTTNSSCVVGEIEYYGHRENDLVRLPDPTNVLKYPHIAMTGPAQRGYVASAVEEYDVPGGSNPNYRAWEAFDDDTNSASGTGYWSSKGGAFNTSSPFQTLRSGGVFVTNVGGTDRTGLWIQLELPHKLKLNLVKYQYRSASSGLPRTGFVVGSNNGTTWEQIYAFENLTASSTTVAHPLTPSGSVSNIAYKYIRLIITHGGGGQYAAAQHIELYGTGVDSIPIQIGGGNIDKVANFRVYDKFVGEDQALEIWDAQKDEFGRAKSSMTLQKGRLGIGTDEPEGRLAVADEPHNLEEFPPRAMTGYKNYFEGHGEFCASSSSELSGTYRAWDAFNHTGTSDPNDAWLTPQNRYTVNSYIDVDPSVAANINGVYGEWLELKLPYKITLDRLTIKTRAGDPYGQPGGPAAGNVWGSNDGLNWTLLTSFTGLTYGGVARPIGIQENVVVNSTIPYSYFRLQPTKRVAASGTDGWIGFGELRYFGTREQGQSVLHDGQLTLTKNLTVPRIGPALDADDTPRRDRLVVEYNTSTNPTFEGGVRDTSGRGFHGALFGGAYYDATEKALRFDGSGDYTEVQLPSHQVKGDWIHSVSCWVKGNVINGEEAVWNIGDRTGQASGVQASTSTLSFNSASPTLRWYFYSNDGSTNLYTIREGEWNHIVLVYYGGGHTGTNSLVYVNGNKVLLNSFTASAPLLFDETRDRVLMLGRLAWSASSDLNGCISNFKLYDCALTAEEAKTLYDMGRCDEGHHVVNFSKTRVGIGLGDGEAPRGALDVRGGVAGPFHTFLTGDYTATSSSPTSSAYSPLASYTFDVPKEYNSYGNANLEVFGQVKWSGEGPDPWNTNFSLRLYYGSGLTSYIGSAQVSGGSNSKGCGMIAISHHADNNSTLDSAVASSKFLIPNCPVSPGSQLKLEILHSQGAGSGTIYTNRTTNAITTDYNYERGTTNFFMALKVV